MRQTYYALAGESGSRYGVSFDRLLWHLWQLRRTRGPIRLRSVKYLEDLVLVIACLDHHGGAWADLIDQYESMLVRRCTERVGEVQAILLVRRMLRRLKNAPHAGARPEGLSQYLADRPLHAWLASRAVGQLHPKTSVWRSSSLTRPAAHPGGAAPKSVQGDAPLALRFPTPHERPRVWPRSPLAEDGGSGPGKPDEPQVGHR